MEIRGQNMLKKLKIIGEKISRQGASVYELYIISDPGHYLPLDFLWITPWSKQKISTGRGTTSLQELVG